MSKDGGEAFPSKRMKYRAGFATNEFEPTPGMSLRDYFAAKAMPGLMFDDRGEPDPYWAAEQAYRCADAMLKAREA